MKEIKKRKKKYVNLEPVDTGLDESHQIIKSLIANKDASHEELSNALDSLNNEPDSELTSSLKSAIHDEIKRRKSELDAHSERMAVALAAKKKEVADKKIQFEKELNNKAAAAKEVDRDNPDFKDDGYNDRHLHYKNQFNYHRLGNYQKAVDKVQWKTTPEGKLKEAQSLAKDLEHLHSHFSRELRQSKNFDHTDKDQVATVQKSFPYLAGKTPSAMKSHFDKVGKSYYHQYADEQYTKLMKQRSEKYHSKRIKKMKPTTIEILTKRAEDSKPLGRKLFSFIAKTATNLRKKPMTEDVKQQSPYFLHVLYGKKGEKGTDDYKTEILKIKNDNSGDHPDQKEIHKTIQSHPISKLHSQNGYNYMYAIGSPHDSPVRSNELLSLLQKNTKDQSHATKIWEELAHELTEDVILSTHKKLANRK